jgi:hypothetical protein
MGFKRLMIRDGAEVRGARAGDHVSQPSVFLQSTDSNQNISVTALAAGVYARTFTAARSDTVPTAADILASDDFRNMDIGDAYRFTITVRSGFALTLVANTGITLVGNTNVVATGTREYLLIRTGAATFDLVGL